MVEQIANATISMLGSNSFSSYTPILTILLILFFGITLFMVWKNFRRVMYGLVVSIPLAIISYTSFKIVKPIETGNWKPLLWTIGIIATIFVMMFIGWILEHFKFVKELEKKLK